MKYQVLDIKGSKVKEIDLLDSIWNIEPHQQALYDTVISQQAALRQGTKKVKTRAEVRGGGRKPWKQKGTGRARQGSIRAPQWRGGGVAFGPTPEINYKKIVNKKVRQLAIKSALSLKVKESNLVILDQITFEKPSTKLMIETMKSLQVDDQKILIITKEIQDTVERSGRNIPKVKIIDGQKMNVYDILDATKLILTEDVVARIGEVYA